MQSFELQPTPENILDTYLNDSIGRNSSIHDFVTVLNRIEGHYSIALEGGWGSGKTFFVKQVMQVLQAQNPFSNCEKRQEIISRIPDTIKAEEVNPQFCVYYDSWTNDNHEDPLLSLIYEILKTTNSSYSFKKARINASQIFKGIANIFSNAIIKTDISSVLNGFEEAEDIFKEIKTEEDLRKSINDFFDSLLVEQGERLVIFIDELDRCKPTFAVKLLERIKHYFMHDRITFVFSVNLQELQHTIKQLYGTDFSASKYLDRFFDFSVTLPPANMENYYMDYESEADKKLLAGICKFLVKEYKLELRDIAKLMSYIEKTSNDFFNRFNEDINSDTNKYTYSYVLLYFYPLVLTLKLINTTTYGSFISGEDISPLMNLLKCNEFHSISNSVFPYSLVFDSDKKADEVLRENVRMFYKALYRSSESEEVHICGNTRITKDIRVSLQKALNLIV